MATVRIPDEKKTLTAPLEIAAYLAQAGIEYERWEPSQFLPVGASNDEILAAYAAGIGELKEREGYATADVIDINPETPGLDDMLAKFNREHWHDDDEVRFIVQGRGLFHIHPSGGPVIAIEVEAGDLIRVPKDTLHWFDLCADRRIQAIRLFKDAAGWVPRYTDSAAEHGYEPVCLGPVYIPLGGAS